ncbi:uncharacterized protein KZ484_025025 [Pholidichthys leucotaenia]
MVRTRLPAQRCRETILSSTRENSNFEAPRGIKEHPPLLVTSHPGQLQSQPSSSPSPGDWFETWSCELSIDQLAHSLITDPNLTGTFDQWSQKQRKENKNKGKTKEKDSQQKHNQINVCFLLMTLGFHWSMSEFQKSEFPVISMDRWQ